MLISFLRDKHSVAEKIDHVGIENCYISEVSIIELTYGAYNSTKIDKHLGRIKGIKIENWRDEKFNEFRQKI